jgi:hypothetical protein
MLTHADDPAVLQGSATYCHPAPCLPPDSPAIPVTGRLRNDHFIVFISDLPSGTGCAPPLFTVTGRIEGEQLAVTGSGRTAACEPVSWHGVLDHTRSRGPMFLSIEEPPDDVLVAADETVQLHGTVRDVLGQEIPEAYFRWLSHRDGLLGTTPLLQLSATQLTVG